MTQPQDYPDRADTKWVTDAELIRRSGVPEKIARETLRALDKNPLSGFPRKNPLWGDRRYYPAVEAYWDRIQAQQNSKPGLANVRYAEGR